MKAWSAPQELSQVLLEYEEREAHEGQGKATIVGMEAAPWEEAE